MDTEGYVIGATVMSMITVAGYAWSASAERQPVWGNVYLITTVILAWLGGGFWTALAFFVVVLLVTFVTTSLINFASRPKRKG